MSPSSVSHPRFCDGFSGHIRTIGTNTISALRKRSRCSIAPSSRLLMLVASDLLKGSDTEKSSRPKGVGDADKSALPPYCLITIRVTKAFECVSLATVFSHKWIATVSSVIPVAVISQRQADLIGTQATESARPSLIIQRPQLIQLFSYIRFHLSSTPCIALYFLNYDKFKESARCWSHPDYCSH